MSKPADFWARRKAAVAEQEAAEARGRAEAEAAEQHARLEEKTDAEILEELGLKDPDEMTAGDDFAAFLKAAVPDRLRRRALRRLWLSNPVLANVDSLVDYGEDYTDAATVVENLQSAIQLGRGALQRAEAQLAAVGDDEATAAGGTGADADTGGGSVRKPEETDRFQSETADPATYDTMPAETTPDEHETRRGGAGASEALGSPPRSEGEEDGQPLRARRMRFHFLD